ncbi:hypothetical protein CANCADRAFT_4121 [Tortispora caseinolytica NRRL Y-17796]|uniref:Cation efflux protein transmembrane domain-containing protein n=1 Tax=Tortispora caseinolytica NRRL Y-17796 TaxID=767744 RepID=A0A1E4TCL0_9ASCO|nr:hypothetical protein CANCADRAFT_4121 [Tortispora caseinolytica NRRL Y-17796]
MIILKPLNRTFRTHHIIVNAYFLRAKPTVRYHGSHNHGGHHHHHHHEGAKLLLGPSSDPRSRITQIGLASNVLIAGVKAIGGWIFSSQALLADAAHAAVDVAADVTTLAAVSASNKPKSNIYPLGRGKVEALASLAVSGLLISAAVGIATPIVYLSLSFIGEHFNIPLLLQLPHVHAHSHHIVSPNAAWLALGSLFVKEWVFRATMKVAHQTKSSVLVANAWHHRADALTSGVALAAIVLAQFVPNQELAALIDPAAGGAVAIIILKASIGTTRQAIWELTDNSKAVNSETRQSIESSIKSALENYPGASLSKLDLLKAGSEVNAFIDIKTDPSSPLKDFQELVHAIEHSVTHTDSEVKVRIKSI